MQAWDITTRTVPGGASLSADMAAVRAYAKSPRVLMLVKTGVLTIVLWGHELSLEEGLDWLSRLARDEISFQGF